MKKLKKLSAIILMLIFSISIISGVYATIDKSVLTQYKYGNIESKVKSLISYENDGLSKESESSTVKVSSESYSDKTIMIEDLIRVRLDQEFKLKQQQSAFVQDYKNMKITYSADNVCESTSKEMVNEIASTDTSTDSIILPKCESGILLTVGISEDMNENKVGFGVATQLPIKVGEKKSVFGATISLLSLNNGIATLKISKDLKLELGRVQVTVMGVDGNKEVSWRGVLYNAKVSVYNGYGNFIKSDYTGKGSAVFYLPVGTYIASASALGYENAKSEFKVESGVDSYLTISLKKSNVNNNQPPVITSISGPFNLVIGEEGTWVVNAYDKEGDYMTYNVDWGEKFLIKSSTSEMGTGIDQQQQVTFTHAYDTTGDYKIVFTVTDKNGAKSKASITVHVYDGKIIPLPKAASSVTTETNSVLSFFKK